jgi:hypothetical protein
MVFDEADAYTCLLFVEKSKQQPKTEYLEIRDLYSKRPELVSNLINGLGKLENIVTDSITPAYEEEVNWWFMTEEERKVFTKISQHDRQAKLKKKNMI